LFSFRSRQEYDEALIYLKKAIEIDGEVCDLSKLSPWAKSPKKQSVGVYF